MSGQLGWSQNMAEMSGGKAIGVHAGLLGILYNTEVLVGFTHDMVNLKKQGFPVQIVSPCEGTGYEVGAVSVVNGTPDVDAAKKWVDYVLSADAQSRGLEVGVFNIPSNPAAKTDPEAPDMAAVKLIDYDFATYGSSATRERLLARWETEVKSKGGTFEQ